MLLFKNLKTNGCMSSLLLADQNSSGLVVQRLHLLLFNKGPHLQQIHNCQGVSTNLMVVRKNCLVAHMNL